MGDNLKRKTIAGLFWKYMEQVGAKGISFVVSMVLARMLLPEDYGAIAIITVFIALADVFVQSGLGTALIQNKNVTEEDFSSVLYLSLGISTILYVVLFFTAPLISAYYKMQILTPVLRILSLKLFLSPLNSVQNAIISRSMEFKKLFYRSMVSTLPSGIVGIIMAYMGFGVWALVGQQLSNAVLTCLVLWFAVNWRPGAVFNIKRVKVLFSFGWKLLASNIINTLYLNIRTLIIGKIYTPDMLGFYNKGWQFPQFITTNIDGSIQSVMLPTLSKVQDEKDRAKSIMRRSIKMSSFFLFPAMAGLAACARPIIVLILTEKWLPCVPFLQIGCIVYALNPIHTANLQAINAMGRSDVFLKLEVIKKIMGLIVIAVTIPFGLYAIVWGSVFNSIASTIINAFPNRKILNYGYLEQLKDIFPNFVYSIIMFTAIYFIGRLNTAVIMILVIQIVAGVIIYYALAFTTKSECLSYARNIIGMAPNKGQGITK